MKKEHKYQGRSERQQENNELIAFMVVTMLAIAGFYLLITKFVIWTIAQSATDPPDRWMYTDTHSV